MEKDYTLGVDRKVQDQKMKELGYDTPEKIQAAFDKSFNVGMFIVPVEEVLARKKQSDGKGA